MNVEELKQYLKDNLTFTLSQSYGDYHTVGISLKVYIENEEICNETVYITEGG